eukprot:s995_g8.t3
MVLNENEPVTVRYASDFVSLDQAVSDLQAPKPETRWCLLELPPEQLKTLEEGQSFHFRELSGGVSQLLRFLVRFVCLDVTMLERPGSPLVVQITRFACLLASARITMDWTLACVSAWTQVSYSGSDLGMKDFKAGLRILASLKLPPVSRSLRRNVTGPSPEDLLPGGAARREEYWENATNATLRWNVDPSMSELHNMRRRAGYQHLATTTRYGDTCCASCGSIDTARLVRGTGFYAVASAESMQDHGIGLSAAQSLESWSEIKIVVADTCPHHGNEAWCPARQGRGNKFGVKHHFDFANPPAKYDNYYFVWTKIDCPYRVKRRYAQLSRNGGWWDGRQNLHCAGPFAVQRPSETCPQSSEIRAHCTLTSRSELSAIVLVASQHAVVFVIMSASAPGDGFAALCTSDSTFRVEFLENSNTLLLGQVKSVDKENAGNLGMLLRNLEVCGVVTATASIAVRKRRVSVRRCAMKRIKRVAVVGGTHGNELSGVILVRSWMRKPSFSEFKSLNVDTFLANEEAVQRCQRFIDEDLNRCFAKSRLSQCHGSDTERSEPKRAREINLRIGPRGSEAASDLCIDLHNTTSNFGSGIIITNTSSPDLHWRLQLCARLARDCPDVHVVFDCVGDSSDEPFLPLGSFMASRQRPAAFTEKLVLGTLDFLERYNAGQLSEEERAAKTIEVYILQSVVHYPRRSDGSLSAIIAPNLQGRDFSLLHPGDPVFQDIDTGESIPWEGPSAQHCGNCATLEQSRCNVFAQCRGQLILKPEKVDMNKVRELLLPSALGQVSAVDQQKLLTFQELQCKVAGSTAELKQVLHDGPYVELDGKWRLMPEKLKTQILDTALTVVTAHGWALEAVDGPSLLEEVQKTLPDGEVSVASLGVLQKALASVVAINPGREL